jgi:hypothetical protein
MSKITWYLNLPLALAHEFCHYLAAHLLRIPAEFHSYHMVFYPDDGSRWKPIVVILAPAAVGIFAICAVIIVAIFSQKWLLIPAALVAGFCWQLTCLSDLNQVYRLMRQGEWPADIWQTPANPQTVADWLHQEDRV